MYYLGIGSHISRTVIRWKNFLNWCKLLLNPATFSETNVAGLTRQTAHTNFINKIDLSDYYVLFQFSKGYLLSMLNCIFAISQIIMQIACESCFN